ncbi:MAG: FAD binding domain-containing protein, partial [Acidimicrobiales bacterium]
MIPAAFDYQVADSADAAIAALAEHGDDAKLLAGGHSLIPLMRFRLATPGVVVDIGRISDLSYINDGGDHVAIGAMTTHRAIETSELLATEAPLLRHVAGQVGDPQVRHRGTLGGSLAHGDPASD